MNWWSVIRRVAVLGLAGAAYVWLVCTFVKYRPEESLPGYYVPICDGSVMTCNIVNGVTDYGSCTCVAPSNLGTCTCDCKILPADARDE